MVSLAIILLCFFTHPVTIFSIGFILLYYLVDNKAWKDKNIYVLAGVTMVLFILKATLTSSNSYEGNHFAELANLFTLLPQFFDYFSTEFLIGHSGKFSYFYIYTEIVLLIVLVNYLFRKEYMKFTFLSGFIVVYLIINNTIYHAGETSMIIEKSFVPLGLFIGLPFVKDVLLRDRKMMILKVAVLLAIIFLRIRDIGKTSKRYTQRLAYIEQVCEKARQFPERKLLTATDNISGEHIPVKWAFALETLLYSSLEGPDNSVTVYPAQEEAELDKVNESDLFLITDFAGQMQASDLNSRYFNLPSTSYRLIQEPL